MAFMSGAKALVETFLRCGVDTLFGVPGAHTLAIYDELIDHPEIRHILARHESTATFMADSYWRASGKEGIVITTTGPGAANTIAPLIEAYNCSSPVLIISSQIESGLIDKGKGGVHEIGGQLKFFEPVTKYAARVSRVEELGEIIGQAVAAMRSGRPRPCFVEIPTDFLAAKADIPIVDVPPRARPAADPELVRRAALMLAEASDPLILAGGGVISSEATPELATLAGMLQCPVLTTVNGKGAIADDHPLSLGSLGNEAETAEFLKGSDLALVAGARLSYISTERWTLPLPSRIIQIDIDPSEIGKNYPALLGLVGDAKLTLGGIIEQLSRLAPDRRVSKAAVVERLRKFVYNGLKERGSTEVEALEAIRDAMGRNATAAFDLTILSFWARFYFKVYEPRDFIFPTGSSTIGFGVPAAIGAKIARPERAVVAVCGDGGFIFSSQEFGTAMQYGLNIPFVVFNDSKYGLLEWLQKKVYGRANQIELFQPDFLEFAASFGANAERVKTMGALRNSLKKALASDKPTLIEVQIPISPPWALTSYIKK